MPHLGDLSRAKREMQVASEPTLFDFHGETFALADEIGAMPLLELAHAAVSGMDTDDPAGFAALRDFISQVIREDDLTVDGKIVARGWSTFRRLATEHKVDGDELLEVAQVLYEAIAARPSQPLSDSSASSQPTTGQSKGGSSSPEFDQRMRAMGMLPVDEAALTLVSSAG